MPSRRNVFTTIVFCCLVLCSPYSSVAATKYKISGKVPAGSADTVMLFTKSGIKRSAVSSNRFMLAKLSSSTLKNSKLYFFKDGAPVGPGVLKEAGNYRYLSFSGKAPAGKTSLSLTFTSKSGYLKAKKKPADPWLAKSKISKSAFTSRSLGYPGAGGSASGRNFRVSPSASDTPNTDSDSDAVPDLLDIDDDNDGIPDDRDSGGGSMISSLYLPFSQTMNAHLGNLNDESIAALFAAENVFGLTFFIDAGNSFPGSTGGHVVCDDSQVICRSSAAGGSSSYYTGISESDPEVIGQRWSDYNADGSGRPNLEPVSFSGGSQMLAAAIQPRSASFSTGELLTANVTNGATVMGTRVFSILPPSISSPMLYSYNAGTGLNTVDYSDEFAPGSSSGNPIVLTGDTLTLNFYPPQRHAISGVEDDGAYRDIGYSSIGALIGGEGISSEFTCAGLYSGLSSGMAEISFDESMPDGAILANQGAILWPVYDSNPDVAYTEGSLKSMTVDLASCLDRASITPGTYTLTLTYAGASTQFGASRSAQMIYVTIS